MDYNVPKIPSLKPPYAEHQTYIQRAGESMFDNNGHGVSWPEQPDLGGYPVSGTATLNSGASGTFQQIVFTYIIPREGPIPEYELQIINYGKLLSERGEVRKNT